MTYLQAVYAEELRSANRPLPREFPQLKDLLEDPIIRRCGSVDTTKR